jgi:RHS repeat-associated protein
LTDAYHNSYCYLYNYTQSGHVATQEMAVTGGFGHYNGITFTANYQWDTEGRMTSQQYPTVHAVGSFGNLSVPMPIAAMQYDANGRLNGMTMDDQDGHGPQPFASATYTPAGQVDHLSWAGYTEVRTYNNLLQLKSQTVAGAMSMTYNYSPTANDGRIVSAVDGVTGENTSYTYDYLDRLTGASNSLWSESYTYDGFGNLLTKSGSGGSPNPAPGMSVSYNANNQVTSQNYDANGNVGGWTYSVENRLTVQVLDYMTGNENVYAYDPWGKRVMSGNDPTPDSGPKPQYTYTFYGITGQALARLTCNGSNYPSYPTCAIVGQNVYFGGKLIVAGGVNVVTDRLGSVRANGQGESFTYYPFGEERSATVDGREKFGTYFRDGVGQDYADQRYYSQSGRFWSPDPAASAAKGAPLSWNRYAYTLGDPINYNDPHGLDFNCMWMETPNGPLQQVCDTADPYGDPHPHQPYSDSDQSSHGPGGVTAIQHSNVPGFSFAMDALESSKCAPAVQHGGTPQSTQAGLNGETYLPWYPGVPPANGLSTVAETNGFNVYLNTTIFTNPENVIVASTTAAGSTDSTEDFVQELIQQFSLDASLVTATDFQAIFLLHELGHSLGGLPPDSTSDNQSLDNTGTIIADCFPTLIKH